MKRAPYIDDQGHTMTDRIKLYRAGKIGPLRYADDTVPVVVCRNCMQSRPDDGTPCRFCGAYQRCTYSPVEDSHTMAARIADSLAFLPPLLKSLRPRKPSKATKPTNPRRRKKND
jgi:hypothetical protein